MDIVSVLYVVLSAGVGYAAFCRITHMSERRTDPSVRRAWATMAVAASAGVFAVLFWGYQPEWPSLLLLAAYAAVLRASRRLWAHGQPKEYER
jgi:fatty acid desaturase